MNFTFFDFRAPIKVNTTLEYYELLRSILKIKRVTGKNFVRIGRPHDGGYIMVDNFSMPYGEGIAYSFGISNDVSWDSDMAARGYDVFMYDPTIKGLPQENERFHFFKQGIAGREIKEQSLNTLDYFLATNGHADKSNMILKMDVEGAEWSFLSTVPAETLSKFDQMVFEFHFMTHEKNQNLMNSTLACIKKINQTHSLVHLHANNHGSFVILDDKILFPETLELTYVKTSNYELVDDENIFLPIPLDQPNNFYRQDITLGFWNRQYNNVVSFN